METMELCYLAKVISQKHVIVYAIINLDTMHDEEELTDYLKNLRDSTGITDDKVFLNLYAIVRRVIDHKKNFSLYLYAITLVSLNKLNSSKKS